MPQLFFQITNTVALLAWIALVAAPGRRLVSHVLCAVLVPGLLAAGYAGVIGWKLLENGPPPGDVTTISGLRAVFTDDWVFAAAWTHYLVFDMVVGAWIARDAVRLGIPWPLRTLALIFTFLSGPVGFLAHLATRYALRQAVDACPAPRPVGDPPREPAAALAGGGQTAENLGSPNLADPRGAANRDRA